MTPPAMRGMRHATKETSWRRWRRRRHREGRLRPRRDSDACPPVPVARLPVRGGGHRDHTPGNAEKTLPLFHSLRAVSQRDQRTKEMMFKCERCGSTFNPIRVSSRQHCPRCRARDGVSVPLTFEMSNSFGGFRVGEFEKNPDPRKPVIESEAPRESGRRDGPLEPLRGVPCGSSRSPREQQRGWS
jgi:hypothetical protein